MSRPVWRDVLECVQLGPEEWASCRTLAGPEARNTARLWGRIAAKEAARRLEVERGPDYRIDGLVASVMAVIVVFSLAYYVLEEQDPSQIDGLHTRIDALYFTVSTLATVGFGDVHAAGQGARVMVLLQMFFNVVFITTAATLLSGRIKAVAEQRSRVRRGEPPTD